MPPAARRTRFAPPSTDRQFTAGKAQAIHLLNALPAARRLPMVRAFCSRMITACWHARCREARCDWPPIPGPIPANPPFGGDGPDTPPIGRLAASLGELAAGFDPVQAVYRLGAVYTAMLPADIRAGYGAYYTPPAYVARLLDQVERAGFDWRHGRILDPACGSGAFLAPLALRLRQALPDESPAAFLEQLAARLQGIEIDPFAGWMAQVLLEAALLDVCLAAGRRLPDLIAIADALSLSGHDAFDLVIGNPPYGRVRLDAGRRLQYARSLHGHANLYGLFTDLAVRLVRPDGIIAYVTPTSFLGGRYFQPLRQLLASEAPPRFIDFIADREGVFDNVLQETLLAVWQKTPGVAPVAVSQLTPDAAQPTGVSIKALGTFALPADHATGAPWILPRAAARNRLFQQLGLLKTRLGDIGYAVSTGPLVWNRHKDQFCSQQVHPDAFPVIWAESVSASGFAFRHARRHHVPFIRLLPGQHHLLARCECVLAQRTTAREQTRRLVAATLPAAFLEAHGGAVVENHLNVLRPADAPVIRPQTLAFLLNSRAVDQAFRCISGSVAVSAYELDALPLPAPADLLAIEQLLAAQADPAVIEAVLDRIYGLDGQGQDLAD